MTYKDRSVVPVYHPGTFSRAGLQNFGCFSPAVLLLLHILRC
jgi:hypothetical protein